LGVSIPSFRGKTFGAKHNRTSEICQPGPQVSPPIIGGRRKSFSGKPLDLFRMLLSGKCALQTFDIELLHLHHGLKGALRFCSVGIVEQLRQDLGDNLPGEAKLIL